MSTLEAHIQLLPKKEKFNGWAELSPALQSVAKVRKRSSSGNFISAGPQSKHRKDGIRSYEKREKLERFAKIRNL